MPILRRGIANPGANTDTVLASFTAPHLISVVVANKAVVATPITRVTIWVVPANANVAAQYAYIASNLELGTGSSFETFRFGVLAGDTLYVRSSTASTSFHVSGILQDDAVLSRNIAETFTNKVIRGEDNTLYLDRGTTAGRRAGVDTGYTRFNTETDSLEVLTAGGWEEVGTGSGSGATGPTGPTGPTGATGPTGPGGGAIDVSNTTDTTTFVGLYEDATGTIGGKTNSGIVYDATAEKLTVTAIETETINAPSSLVGTYTITSPTTITLDPTDEIINDAPMQLVGKTVAELGTLVASVGSIVFCTNESGGSTVAFYDGSDWRRVSDRQVVS